MQREDTLGICLSGLCVVHCLGIPILIALSPALGWMEQEWVHLLLACLALVVTLWAMRNWSRGLVLKLLAFAGLALLFTGALAEVSETVERVITVAGASGLALAHFFGQRGDAMFRRS